jgi:hypothetical protein
MRILAMAAMAMVAGTGAASARIIEVPSGTVVPVCVESALANSREWATMFLAKGLASKIFASAGVTINWRHADGCPADGIRIRLARNAADSDDPHAYAYAMPVEGVHIVLFQDRIAAGAGGARSQAARYLLAYVLVHEITHILQGTPRHSDTGIMKAKFTGDDIREMEFQPLSFTEEDLQLIHDGLKVRQTRLVAQISASGLLD